VSYEFLDLHSKDHRPAADLTFFLCVIGYWSQSLVGAAYAATIDNPFRGAWTKEVVRMLLISALFDGAAQALDYVGQVRALLTRLRVDQSCAAMVPLCWLWRR